jgi:CRISPR-associated protein Cst2
MELNKKEEAELDTETKVSRLTALITSLEHLWGGGKQSRLLSDMSPKFVAYSRQNSKKPIFLETMRMKHDEIGAVNLDLLNNTFASNENIIQKKLVGYLPNFFVNEKEIKNVFEDILSIEKCLESIRLDIRSVY